MAMDWNSIAPMVQQLAPLVGAAAGGGLHNAGFTAGLGDALHEQNVRSANVQQKSREDFADQLLKIGSDEANWNEPARTAALQSRLEILGNPKAGAKDFQRHWQNILSASQRPSLPQQQEQNAAATQTAGLKNLSAGGGGGGGGLDALGPGVGAGMEAWQQQAQAAANRTPSAVSGPLTPAEKAQRSIEQFRAFQQLGSSGGMGAGGVGGGGAVMPMMGIAANGHPTMHMRVDTSRPLVLQVGSDTVPGYWDAARQSYFRSDTHQPVVPDNVLNLDRPLMVEQADANGAPVKTVVSRNQSIGKSFAQPVRMADETVTNNGTVSKFTRNPFTGKTTAPYATGTTPNRDLGVTRVGQAERGLELRQAANARQQGTYDYNVGGVAIDTDGSITGTPGASFTPAGTPVDEAGNPISKLGFSQTKPPSAIQTRARVAADARNQADTLLKAVSNPALASQFGPIEGRAMQWFVQHGIVRDTDIKALQMQMASLESMNPAVHQMRNFAVAQDIAHRLGDMGQPVENFVAGVQTLRNFYDEVAQSGIKPVLKTAGQPKAMTPRAPAGATPLPNSKAGKAAPTAIAPSKPSNAETLQQILQLLKK